MWSCVRSAVDCTRQELTFQPSRFQEIRTENLYDRLRTMTEILSTGRFIVSIVLAIGLTAWLGCAQDKQATVSGRVTIDGRPLDRGVVTFVNALEKSSAGMSGQIRPDGIYHVQIGQSGEVVAGEYAVKVDARKASVPRPDGAPPAPGDLLLPIRYTRVETSGLRYHVRPGANVIDIALAGDRAGDTDPTNGDPAVVEGVQEVGEATPAPEAEKESPQSTEDQP